MSERRRSVSQLGKATKRSRRGLLKGADPKIPLTARDKSAGEWFAKLVALQARLRGADGCPWDREQTHESLRKFLIEETYEVLDAMESGEARKFSSELGDLLLQVVFHSILAEESGDFSISDVIESVYTKMVRRHPHVFGDSKAATSAQVLKNWEQLKAAERGEETGSSESASTSVLAGVPHSLPAVLEAYQLTERASRVGFDWDSLDGVFDKVDEEKREVMSIVASAGESAGHTSSTRDGKVAGRDSSNRSASRTTAADAARSLEEEAGDLLFAAVNIARFLGIEPEIALKKANRKFKRRFKWMESAAEREGKWFAELPRERMEELWNESKTQTSTKGKD